MKESEAHEGLIDAFSPTKLQNSRKGEKGWTS